MESWFGAGLRTRMAVGVDEIVRGGRRKCFFDEAGDDLRLRTPGVRWEDVRKIRRNVLESVGSNLQEVFDKIHDQIVNDRRISLNRHLLPTVKTPAVSKKTRSRVQPRKESNSPQQQIVPSSPPHTLTSSPSTLRTSLLNTFTPRSVARMKTEVPPTDNDTLQSHSTHTQNYSYSKSSSNDKENVTETAVDASCAPQLSRNKPRNNANARVEDLAGEEMVSGRVTRSSARVKRGRAGSPRAATVRRTTRSQAAKTARKKPKSSPSTEESSASSEGENSSAHTRVKSEAEVEVVVVEEEEPNTSVVCSTTVPVMTVRRSTRVQARESRAFNAGVAPPQLASPLLQSQRKQLHISAQKATKSTQPQPSTQPSPNSTDTAEAVSSAESKSLHTPPVEVTTAPKTKSDTPYPTATNSPTTLTPQEIDNVSPQPESSSGEQPQQNNAAQSDSIAVSAKAGLCVTPSPNEMLESTLCDSSPLNKWFTSMSTVVKLDCSKPDSATAAESVPTSVDEPVLVDDPAPSNQLDDVPSPMYDQLLTPEHTAEVSHPSPSPGSQLETERNNQLRTPESTDSGISSGRSERGQREKSESLLGRKRLRSVSLERVSLSEFETKRVSVEPAVPEDSPGDDVTEGDSEVENDSHPHKECVVNEDILSTESDEMNSSKTREPGTDDSVTFEDSQQSCEKSSPATTGSDRPLPSSGGSEEEAMDHCPLTAEEVRETEMGSSPEQEERAVSSDLSPEESSEGTSPDEPQKLPSSENRDTVWRSVCGKTVTKPTTTNPHSPSSATTELAGMGLGKSPVLNLKRTKGSPWAFLSHKTHFHDIPLKNALQDMASRPATFLSPKASPKRPEKGVGVNGVALPHSFLAKSSPQQIVKAKNKAVRQQKLLEHMQKKREEEDQRKRDLEEKRVQEVELRKRRNAERAQRAADKRRQGEERRLMQIKKTQEQVDEQISKKQMKLYRLRADERKEKSKKHNERVAAVLARKKLEEDMKAKKLQQIEEDRKMAEELFKQRQEREEEERQMKRTEKQEREKERLQQLREAEEKEKQLSKEPEPESAVQSKTTWPRPALAIKKQDFKLLLASTCAMSIPTASSHVSQWKPPNKGPAAMVTVTKPHPTLLPGPAHHDTSPSECSPPESCNDTQTSELNSTFTIDTAATTSTNATATTTSTVEHVELQVPSSATDIFVTPHKPLTATKSSSHTADSYEMTPADTRVSNYGIDDLSAGDSTDEEDRPKKSIPAWAKVDNLRLLMSCQEEGVYSGQVKPCLIFPAVELMREVNLARIFKVKRKRFFHRSSSAKWDSPALLKKGKFEGFSTLLV